MWCCEPCSGEEKEHSKAVDIISSKLSNLFRCIRDEVDTPEEQEKMCMQVFKILGTFTDIAKLAEKLLEIEKQLKLKEIKEDKTEQVEEKKESVEFVTMFEDLSGKTE